MKIIRILIAFAVVMGVIFSSAQFASASIPATGGTTITLGIPNGWASAYPPYGPSLPPLTFSSGVPLTISTASMGTYLYYSLACCATAQLSAVSDGSTVTLTIYGSTYGAGEGVWTYPLGTLTCPPGYTLSGTVCNLNTGTIVVSSNIASSWTITPGPIFGSGTSWSFPSATSGPTTYAITWDAVAGYDFPPTTLISASQTLTTGGTITFKGTYTLTPTVPTVTTPTVASITTTGATLGATVISPGVTIDGKLSAKTDYTTGARPNAVTISPDGTSVYVANNTDNTVSMFTRNTSTGALSAKTDYATGNRPVAVTISSDGTSVYVANQNSNTVSMFTRNTSTGALSAKTDYATGNRPVAVTISSDGTSVYVANQNSNTVSMFTRNTSTGTLSAKTDYTTGTAPTSVTISASGTSVYVTNQNSNTVSMFTRNTSTGTLSAKTDYTTGTAPGSVTVSASGTSVYVANQNSNTVSMFTRNTSTGTLSAKTDYTTGAVPADVVVSLDGTSVYVANNTDNTVSMFTRNTSTGTLSAKTDYATGARPNAVTISPDGTSVYVPNQNSNTVSMFARNPFVALTRGTCWGTTPAPVTNCTAEGGTTAGIFTQARTGMAQGTTYYYRGYATNSTGTGYSADGTFTTTAVCANGTTNYPTCSQCSSGQAYNIISSQCQVCTGGCSGAGDIYGNGAACLNGASNPPFCILASCTLPWGANLLSGNTAPAYSVSSVISPATCPAPQTYTCTNGVLSGSTYTNQNCTSTVVKLKYQQF